MTTAVRQGDLQILGQVLQERLQLKFFPNGPLQVKCVRQQETLMVLGQHPEVVVPDPQKVFSTLEQVIKTVHLDWTHKVQLYLKVANKQDPYASHTFTLKPPEASGESSIAEAATNPPPTRAEASTLTADDANWLAADVWDLTEETRSPDPELSTASSAIALDPSPPTEEVQSEATVEERQDAGASRSDPEGNRSSLYLLPTIVAGASVTLLLLLLGVYPLTRPCVLGKCSEIKTSRKLGDESAKLLQEAKSARAPVEAQKKLTEATELLKTIPFWSFYYPEARDLLQNYESQTEQLDEVLAIQKKASAAAQKSQNPPHSVQTWQEIQSMWRGTIAQLEQIPDNSEIYSWRERKLKEYRSNLATINQRINVEKQAEKKLKAAKSAAQIAEARQGVAQSLDSWQLVYATWQTAVNTLQQIPKGTRSEEEAQQLLESYQSKLAEARDRKATEQIAADTYKQSLRVADSAKLAEQKNQWSIAVTLWRQAQNYAQRVPVGSNYYTQAQQLQAAHTNSLQRSQARLQVAVAMQKARADLKKTCGGSPKVCDYAVTSDLMTVYITSEYQKSIRQMATVADKKGDKKIRLKVDAHVNTLQTALEAISSNARIPISVYDPSGAIVGSYNPRI